MKSLPPGYNTKELEANIKNKWRWQWLNEIDEDGEKWGQWLKIAGHGLGGIAFCEVCGRTLSYKSSGKKAFKLHAADSQHKQNMRTVKENQPQNEERIYLRSRKMGVESVILGVTVYPM